MEEQREFDGAKAPVLGPIDPGSRVSLADAVARSLRAALLSGELRPGERILQDRLAAELGVSRAPVRDAIQRLQAEGLLMELANGGLAVREFSHQDLCENYLLRILLEGEATRIASRTMSDEEIDRLAAVNAAMRDAIKRVEPRQVLDLNDEFHRLIREGARQHTLTEFIETLWRRMAIKTRILLPSRAPHSIVEHDAIVAALRDHSPSDAYEEAQNHVETACREYLSASGLIATPELEDWLSRRPRRVSA